MAEPVLYGSTPLVLGKGGDAYACADLGIDPSTIGPGFRATEVVDGQRARELEYRERFYRCAQHDGKVFDFNGRMIVPGPASTQPLLSSVSTGSFYVPLDQRRPSSPYRLPRVIVNAFTSLLFGHGRWPKILVVGDPDTQDFAEALVEAQRLPTVMIRARNIGGSVGTVGLSWRFYEGRPRTRVHNGRYLWVHKWADREELVPEHVSEIYQTARDEYDPRSRKIVRNFYWHRRDWTPLADIAFCEQLVSAKKDPTWILDEDETHVHGDGFAHFVWVQNRPEDDDATSIDGVSDYQGLDENFGALDVLNSVVNRGAALNLDPTVVLKMNPEIAKRQPVRKGSDNAISVGETGDAKYMELAGSSLEAGNKLVDRERKQVLEVAQCVSPDPDQIAAAGTSGVALTMVHAPMLGSCDVLRDQYGAAILRLLDQQIRSARRSLPGQDAEGRPVYEVTTGEDGEQVEVEYFLALPPRVVTEDVLDAEGNPTGETRTTYVERHPGAGGAMKLEWGKYFVETTADRTAEAQTLSTLAGGKPVLSHRSVVEAAARSYGLDPRKEWEAVAAQVEADRARQVDMFPPFGGGVGAENEIPPGAAPRGALPESTEEEGEPPAAKDVKPVMTVNEFRARAVPPLPALPDPDGSMTVAEFEAYREARGKALGEAAGKPVDDGAATAAPAVAGPQGGAVLAPGEPPREATAGDEQLPDEPGGRAALEGGPAGVDEEAATDTNAAEQLAAKMTEHGVERCAHERTNRCPLCGIERVHDFDEATGGAAKWKIAWRAIAR